MIPDGHYSAIVDRIEDGLVALEVDVGGDLRELVVDADAVPEPAREADTALEIEIRDGELDGVAVDAERTEKRMEEAQSRFDRLSRRPPDPGDDDRKEY